MVIEVELICMRRGTLYFFSCRLGYLTICGSIGGNEDAAMNMLSHYVRLNEWCLDMLVEGVRIGCIGSRTSS